MNIKEVFCIDCYEWKKKEDLTGSKFSNDILYCKECGYALVRTCDRNNK
ncbi:hypothetical protein [Streptococcus phage D4446]|nr:hypothetical protein [Streptococcus phage D4446]